MKSKTFVALAGASALLVCSQIASAHPGHGGATGFAGGLAHPFSGIDHILAMIAVGLCAAQLGGRALWLLPATFLACMIGAGWAGVGHSANVPGVEQGIAASVLVLGLLIASGSRLGLPMIAGIVALFAAFHGYAHGTEAGASPAGFAGGFVLATATLLSIGLGAGLILKRARWTTLSRIAGGAIAVCGVALFII